MPSNANPTSSNLKRVGRSAEFWARMAEAARDKWFHLRVHLASLEACERYAPYVRLPLEFNKSALQNCWCEAIQECLKLVVKVQRKLEKCCKDIKIWVRREKRAHDSYMDMLK